MASWLDALLGKIFSRGEPVELQGGLNFASPLQAVPNITDERIDVSLEDGVITAATIANDDTTGLPGATLAEVSLEAQALRDAEESPSGFVTLDTSTITRDDGSRLFTVAATGTSFDYYLSGRRQTVTGSAVVTWGDVEGVWNFGFDGDGTLVANQDPDIANDWIAGGGCLVATLYWDADAGASYLFGDKRQRLMGGQERFHFHRGWGAQYYDGGALTDITADGDGSADAHAQLGYDAGTAGSAAHLIEWAAVAGPAQVPVYYRSGAGVWRRKEADNFPVVYAGSVSGYAGSLCAYNDYTGGVFSLAECGEGEYVLVHLLASDAPSEPVIAVLGGASYPTLAEAYAGVTTEIAGLTDAKPPETEVVLLGTILVQTSTGYSNAPAARLVSWATGDYVDLRGPAPSRNAAPVTSVFGRFDGVQAAAGDYDADQVDFDPTGLGMSATDVQTAIDKALPYHYRAHVAASSTAVVGTDAWTLTEDENDAGAYTLASNEITVPAAGRYKVSHGITASNGSGTSNSRTGSSILVGGTAVQSRQSLRAGVDTSLPVGVDMTDEVIITTPASETISIAPVGANAVTLTAYDALNTLTISGPYPIRTA